MPRQELARCCCWGGSPRPPPSGAEIGAEEVLGCPQLSPKSPAQWSKPRVPSQELARCCCWGVPLPSGAETGADAVPGCLQLSFETGAQQCPASQSWSRRESG